MKAKTITSLVIYFNVAMAYISHYLYFAFVWGRGKEAEHTQRYSVLKTDTLYSGHNYN